VASIAQDKAESGKAAKAPISTHAAFPFVVAIWFAALLGIGSLVVPVSVIEQIATSTGLSSIIPAAAPPLGFTARAMIALAFTVLGAVAGLLIARQVAKAHGADKNLKRERSLGRKPIDAHAELGGEGLGTAPRGRRALAITDDGGPSEFFDLAPLPGVSRHEEEAVLADEAEEEVEVTIEGTTESDEEPTVPLGLAELDLAEFGEDEEEEAAEFEPETDDEPEFTGQQEFAPSEDEDRFEEQTMSDRQDFIADREMQDEVALEPVADNTEFASAWLEQEEDEVMEAAGDDAPQSFLPEVDDEPASEAAGEEFEAGLSVDRKDSELDEIGLVQLAQRLGASIEKHRAFRSARAAALASAAKPVAKPLAEDFEVAEADEAAAAMANFFGGNASHDEAPVDEVADDVLETEEVSAKEEGEEIDVTFARTFDAPSGESEKAEDEASPFSGFSAEMSEDDDLESEMDSEEVAEQTAEPVQPSSTPARSTLFERMAGLSRGEETEVDEEVAEVEEEETPAPVDLSRPAEAEEVVESAEVVEDGEMEAGVEDDERQVFQPSAPAEDKPTYKPFAGFADIAAEEDEVDDLAASFSLPIQRMRAEAAQEATQQPAADPVAAEPEVADAVPQDDGEDFEATQAMDNPFKQKAEKFVRIEDEPQDVSGDFEPAVVFPNAGGEAATPGQSAKPTQFASERQAAKLDPEENERALREALLNLQRMSGAA